MRARGALRLRSGQAFLALLAVGAFVLACSETAEPPLDSTGSASCSRGVSPSDENSLSLEEAQERLPFTIAYPCRLPKGFRLRRVLVIGSDSGAYSLTLVFERPGFDNTIQLTQSEVEPGFFAIPSGMSITRPTVQGVQARFVQGESDSGDYFLYLSWSKGGLSYQLQGSEGGGLTRDSFLATAESIRLSRP